jgi:hypothetical protein
MWRASRLCDWQFRFGRSSCHIPIWRPRHQHDGDDDGSRSGQTKRRHTTQIVNGHGNQKAEHREAVEPWHDTPQQSENAGMTNLGRREGRRPHSTRSERV